MATYKVRRNNSKSSNSFSGFNKTRLEMNMQLVPHARWGAGEHYYVKGFGNAVFTGMYRFDKVTHSISQDGYGVDVDAVKIKMPTSSSNKPNNSKKAKRKKDIVHIVRKGDNLWDILKKYGRNPENYRALAKFNKIKNPHYILPNQKVVIPPNV